MAKRKTKAKPKPSKRSAANPNDDGLIPIGDLTPDPGNVRRHGKAAQDSLDRSVRRFGAARSVVADEANVIRAGNDTLRAAAEAGMTHAKIVEADGKTLVVVRRSDWSHEEATDYALADNKIGELSDFDLESLAGHLHDAQARGVDLLDLGVLEHEESILLAASFEPGKPTGEDLSKDQINIVRFTQEQWAIIETLTGSQGDPAGMLTDLAAKEIESR